MKEEKQLVKQSIFKQEQHRRTYEFMNTVVDRYYLNGNRYYAGMIMTKTEKVDESEIFLCDLEMPMLDVGEEFYIEELDKTVIIRKRVRSSKENVCYYVDPEIIEDEESKRTKELSENQQNKFNVFKNELTNLKKFKKQVVKSFWFKFIHIKN